MQSNLNYIFIPALSESLEFSIFHQSNISYKVWLYSKKKNILRNFNNVIIIIDIDRQSQSFPPFSQREGIVGEIHHAVKKGIGV